MQPVTLAGKLPCKFISLLLAAIILSSCAQFTTDDQELAALKQATEEPGDAYINCMKTEAANYSSSDTEISYVVDAAGRKCQAEMDKYEAAQQEYQGAQFMKSGGKVTEATAEINQRASDEIAEMMLTRQSQPASASAPNSAPAAVAIVAAPAAGWDSQQRVYLDCMEDQAHKYASLDESAPTIAEVAQSRCNTYIDRADAALEQEGRSLVMGIVFDARVKPARQ